MRKPLTTPFQVVEEAQRSPAAAHREKKNSFPSKQGIRVMGDLLHVGPDPCKLNSPISPYMSNEAQKDRC